MGLLSQDFLTKSSKVMIFCYRETRERAARDDPSIGWSGANSARVAALIKAAQAFIAAGKSNVPVLEITQAADVGMGSFYNHFESKEELFEAAVADVLDNHGALLDQLTAIDRRSRRNLRLQLPADRPTLPAPPAGEPDPAWRAA